MNYLNNNNSNQFCKEIQLKNKTIDDMQIRINNLMEEKQCLNCAIQDLQSQNYNLGLKNQQENDEMDFHIQNKINQLNQTINLLKNENNILKNHLNKKEKIEENYNNTISKQLNESKREIENLKEMNSIKDNLLNDYHDFMYELNEIVGQKILNCELDYNNNDLETYKNNFEKIKHKVLAYLNYDNFHRPYIQPINIPNYINYNNNINNINNENIENNINNENYIIKNNNNDLRTISDISKKTFSGDLIPPRPDLILYKKDNSNSNLNKSLSKDLNTHSKNCKCPGCRYKAMRDPSFLGERPIIREPKIHSILRTPPRFNE